MYTYRNPTPIVITLIDDAGVLLRQKAADYLALNQNKTGAERGSLDEQGFGALAEMVIRNKLGMPEINPEDHPLAYDILLPSGVKADVKCRGGALPFKEQYDSSDGIKREAKHNFFARQINDDSLDTDIYILTHLETPKVRTLPGTTRQRKWILYVCGWVSKKRVARDGVYLPRGSLTEQGNSWFTYRGQEIEFYHRHLNGLNDVRDLLTIEKSDVAGDAQKTKDLNLTSADAVRITYDLVGHGILRDEHLDYVKKAVGISTPVKPILHPNQYFHLLQWLKYNGKITDKELKSAQKFFQSQPYGGI